VPEADSESETETIHGEGRDRVCRVRPSVSRNEKDSRRTDKNCPFHHESLMAMHVCVETGRRNCSKNTTPVGRDGGARGVKAGIGRTSAVRVQLGEGWPLSRQSKGVGWDANHLALMAESAVRRPSQHGICCDKHGSLSSSISFSALSRCASKRRLTIPEDGLLPSQMDGQAGRRARHHPPMRFRPR
jgi:hypothetical protein